MRDIRSKLVLAGTLLAGMMSTQALSQNSEKAQVRLRVASTMAGKSRPIPEAAWLTPSAGGAQLTFAPTAHYTLLQKERAFHPHLLVIPVGATVQFPNADPFFHNVFSLFNGKRFDLGLYEAGSSKSVNFSREGISYIFCDIHPEMSAVILALLTPLYAIGNSEGVFVFPDAPPGEYDLHVWVEGVPQPSLNGLTRRIRLQTGQNDLGILRVPLPSPEKSAHPDKFGKDYAPAAPAPY